MERNETIMYKLCKKAAAREGFTLVELIVVIAILGILAGVSVPVYSGYIAKAEEAADLQLLGAVNTAWAVACVENGVDPTQVTGAVTLSGQVGNKTVEGVSASGLGTETAAALNDSFMTFYGDNASKPFKVYSSLGYDRANGVFTGVKAGGAAQALASIWNSNGNSFKGNEATLLGALDNVSGIVGGSETLMKIVSGNADALQAVFSKMFSNPHYVEDLSRFSLDEAMNSYIDSNDNESYMNVMHEIAAYVQDDTMKASILSKMSAADNDPDAFFASLTADEESEMSGLIPNPDGGFMSCYESAYARYATDQFGASIAAQYGGTEENFEKMSSDMDALSAALGGKSGTELGNAAVLYIADHTVGLDAGTAFSEMQNVMLDLANAGSTSVALPLLAQTNAIAGNSRNDVFTTTAMAYALATGYYNNKGETAPAPSSLQEALDMIAAAAKNADFSTYMNAKGQADLEAYIAAMGAMNEKAGDISTGSKTAFTEQLGWLTELLAG